VPVSTVAAVVPFMLRIQHYRVKEVLHNEVLVHFA
jgi:hypothetical protein